MQTFLLCVGCAMLVVAGFLTGALVHVYQHIQMKESMTFGEFQVMQESNASIKKYLANYGTIIRVRKQLMAVVMILIIAGAMLVSGGANILN